MTPSPVSQNTSALTNPPWRVFGFSQTGSAHRRLGAVNQDHVDWRSDPLGRRFAAAVADGHGAAPHFRSDIGARLAVQSALECLERRLANGADASPSNGVAGTSIGNVISNAIGAEIESRWIDLVQAHLREHPYTHREFASREFASHEDSAGTRPYGSTLVAAAASPRWLVTAQIGDGDSCLGYAGKPLQRIDAAQDQFQGEQTLSLCLENAAQYFTIHVVDLDWSASPPDFVVLSTDGVAKSFPSSAAYERAVAQFREMCMSPSNQFADVAKHIPAWLNEVSLRGSGDDATLLLAMRKLQSDVW